MIPSVTADQMREVDRLMTEELHIDLVQMMENAGRALAEQARRMVGASYNARIVVLAGGGGNGGGGAAAARRLAIWGADVSLVLARPRASMTPVAARQVEIAERSGAVLADEDAVRGAALIIDALVGYSLRGGPRGRVAELITAANTSHVPILALDVPSGLDPDTGAVHEPTIRASATLTLALPKAGLFAPCARGWVGELYLADISVPAAVYRKLRIDVGPIFAKADIVPVWLPD